MNNCKKCGNQTLQNQKFCSNCGEPTNNMVINQPINNSINQQNNNEILNQNNNTNNMNNNQSIYVNQNNNAQPSYEQTNNINNEINRNNKEDKLPYIIMIGLVVILIIVISILLILNNKPNNKKSNNNNNKNEYEENINEPNNTTNSTNPDNNIDNPNTNDNNSINFKGFKINKNSGYTYQATDKKLTIYNSNYYIGLLVSTGNFNTVKTNIPALEQSYLKSTQNSQMSVSNLKLKNINNTEVIIGNAVVDGQTGVWFVIKANSLYVYQGFIINRSNTYNENNVNIVLNLLKDSVYVGNYSSYTTTFDIKGLSDKKE